MTFGRLKVIKRVEDYISPKGYHKSQWLCECSCENKTQIIAIGNNLTRGKTRSCGCIHDERAVELGKSKKKVNTYIDKGDYYDVLTDKGNHFFIDKEDKEKLICIIGNLIVKVMLFIVYILQENSCCYIE